MQCPGIPIFHSLEGPQLEESLRLGVTAVGNGCLQVGAILEGGGRPLGSAPTPGRPCCRHRTVTWAKEGLSQVHGSRGIWRLQDLGPGVRWTRVFRILSQGWTVARCVCGGGRSSASPWLAVTPPPEVTLPVEIFTSIVYVRATLLQSCLTLCDLSTVACQAPLSMGFSRHNNAQGNNAKPTAMAQVSAGVRVLCRALPPAETSRSRPHTYLVCQPPQAL